MNGSLFIVLKVGEVSLAVRLTFSSPLIDVHMTVIRNFHHQIKGESDHVYAKMDRKTKQIFAIVRSITHRKKVLFALSIDLLL